MYRISHKNVLKTPVDKRATRGRHLGGKSATAGRQKPAFFRADFLTSRRLVNGVSFLLHFVGLGCLSVISPTWVRDATVLGFSADLQISVSYETPGGN